MVLWGDDDQFPMDRGGTEIVDCTIRPYDWAAEPGEEF
jgi:hypothetical protein